MLPTITACARFAFKHSNSDARAEATQEVIANALVAYARLVARGKTEVAYAGVLARFAVAQYRAGRRVGIKLNIHDVTSPHAEAQRGIAVERLDQFDHTQGQWHEALVEDRRAGPAETAAARIDVAAWFNSLTARCRRIAKTLAKGETTGATARKFGLSAGRVSQLRQELEVSWQQFQGQGG
ncbi:MAG TPA: hypothetical protein VHY20_07410 [Pirellulales bacterium]|nr:hypothetical protein [Pirellulales bacterium]